MMAKTAPRPDLIVLQPTPFCNISCSYCYLRDRDQPITMQPDTVRRIFQALGELVDLPSSIEVLWHAGEPMVLGPSWYRRSFDIIANSAPSQLTIHHGMQTNGTLISPEWCDTIAEHRIGLGVSIDGPEDIQNACRRTRKGSGTYKRLMAGLELLTHRKIEFGAICVITEHSVDKPQEFGLRPVWLTPS